MYVPKNRSSSTSPLYYTHTLTHIRGRTHTHTKKMLIKSRCRGLFLYNWCDTTPWKKTRLNKRHRQGDQSQKLSAFCSGPNVLHLCQIRARSGPDPYRNPLLSGFHGSYACVQFRRTAGSVCLHVCVGGTEVTCWLAVGAGQRAGPAVFWARLNATFSCQRAKNIPLHALICGVMSRCTWLFELRQGVCLADMEYRTRRKKTLKTM